MSSKILFGIIIPSLLIVVLVVFGSWDVGMSVRKFSVASASRAELLSTGGNDEILLQTITIVNDYFLSKQYEVTYHVACLHDFEEGASLRALSLYYSEATLREENSAAVFGSSRSISNWRSNWVSIPAGATKQVKMFIKPYLRNQDIQQYDEILLIERKQQNGRDSMLYESSYIYGCEGMTPDELDRAVRIAIV